MRFCKRGTAEREQFRSATSLLLTAGALAIIFCTSCGNRRSNAGANEAPPAPVVRVAPVEYKTVPIYADFVGQTAAQNTVNIEARVTGFLEKIYFTEGSRVKAGQVLFKIEQAPYQAQLESAQAKLSQDQASLLKAEQDVARLQPLVAQSAAPAQDLDASVAARAEYQAAIKADKASIDTAKLNLSYTIVYSPIDGIIGRLQVTFGNLVGQGQPTTLATVSSYDPIYVYFAVPEATYLDYQRRHPGAQSRRGAERMDLELVLANGQPFGHNGRINFADRTVDVSTGTLSLRGEFRNPDALLRPGQFARVRFVVEQRRDAILVPKQAITETLNTKGVMVLGKDNKVELKTITTDGEYEENTIVHSGLQAGQQVIVEGLQKVRPGMVVSPKTENTARE